MLQQPLQTEWLNICKILYITVFLIHNHCNKKINRHSRVDGLSL